MLLTITAAAGAAAVAGGGAYFAPHLAKLMQIRALRSGAARRGMLALTYDDGPGLALTPRLLELLEQAGARATFFITAAGVRRAPQLIDALVAAGHELGCHSHSHLHPCRTLPWRVVGDMQDGYDVLDRWLRPTAPFRPPCGKVTLPTWLAARRRGRRLAWWTVDSGDTWRELPDPHMVVERVASDGGGVILMHDFDRTGADAAERAEHVVTITTRVLALARTRGLSVCRFSDLFA